MRQAKQAREKLRAAGVSPETEAQLIKESQFQKAEYKRLEKRIKNEIDTQAVLVHRHEALIRQLKEERKHRSAALQLRLFQQFQMLNAKGEHKDLCQIFQDTLQGTLLPEPENAPCPNCSNTPTSTSCIRWLWVNSGGECPPRKKSVITDTFTPPVRENVHLSWHTCSSD